MKTTNKKNVMFVLMLFGTITMIGLIGRFLPDASEFISKGTISLVTLLIVIPIYLVPMIVSIKRGHPQAGTISVINLFLGWTVLGWVVSMAWAMSAIEKKEDQ